MISNFFPVAPMINLQDKYSTERGQAVSLHCRVEGNPPPTITWTPCNPCPCDESFLNISNVWMNAEYTCAAKNSLGKKSATTNLGKLAQVALYICTCSYYLAALSMMKRSALIGSQSSLTFLYRLP